MNLFRRLSAAGFVAALVLTVLTTVVRPADAAPGAAPVRTVTALPAKAVQAVVVEADLRVMTMTTQPLPGEGMIRITTRVCGDASNWQSVAADNNVVPPVYLVLLGQTISVNCDSLTSTPAAPPAAPAAAPVAVTSEWVNPLPGHTGGNCNYWEWRGSYNHRGEDWPAPWGTEIRAAHAGNVSTSWDGGGGNMTVITHDGMAEVYMHQSSFAVTGGWVNAGDVIGYVGSTGNSTGPHLHFEVQPWGAWNGVVDPVSYLQERGVDVGC